MKADMDARRKKLVDEIGDLLFCLEELPPLCVAAAASAVAEYCEDGVEKLHRDAERDAQMRLERRARVDLGIAQGAKIIGELAAVLTRWADETAVTAGVPGEDLLPHAPLYDESNPKENA